MKILFFYKKYNIKEIVFFTLLFLMFSPAYSQEYLLVKEIQIEGKMLRVDNLGNTYVVTQRNELRKYDNKGAFQQFYNEFRFGKISHVDVSNPMKKVVYFSQYYTIRILDVTLSTKGLVSLLNMGFDKVTAVCQSLDNHLWIYDEISFQLKKISDKLTIIQESENLSTLLQLNILPNFILEKDNILMLNDPEEGILIFDVYTTYIKTIPIKGLNEFQKIKDFLYYYKDGKLNSFHMKTLEFKEIKIPEVNEEIVSVKIEVNLLSVLTKTKLYIYSY